MDNTQWDELCSDISDLYKVVLDNKDGKTAEYIPQLAKINPELFGISVYSLDNKFFGIGDTLEDFCIQSCSKTLTYAVALKDNGTEVMNRHIGKEPSGARFNAFVFDDENKPFNPLINSGAIMSAAMVKGDSKDDERFEYIIDTWKSIVGKDNVGFDNAVYLSEKNTANRNHALAHIMMENNVFPENTDITKTLEFYFQLCSITMNSKSLAKYAALLANGGKTIDTNNQIFGPSIVRDLLCMMYSSGMYDYSGRWSFDIGLPAKSGVSGAIFAVIPHIGGICVYSPRLDELGNSVRGTDFFRRLTDKYRLHIFDTLISGLDTKKTLYKNADDQLGQVYTACQTNQSIVLEQLFSKHVININQGDYDKRCPLHIAMDDEHYYICYLLISYGAKYRLKDRWGCSMQTKIVKDKHISLGALHLLYYFKRLRLRDALSKLGPSA